MGKSTSRDRDGQGYFRSMYRVKLERCLPHKAGIESSLLPLIIEKLSKSKELGQWAARSQLFPIPIFTSKGTFSL